MKSIERGRHHTNIILVGATSIQDLQCAPLIALSLCFLPLATLSVGHLVLFL
jgi:hypothetical protein